MKGYRIWFPDIKKIGTHRDVIFESEQMAPNIEKDEKEEQHIKSKVTSQDENTDTEEDAIEEEENEEDTIEEEENKEDTFQDTEEQPAAEGEECTNLDSNYTLRDRRTINPPNRYKSFFKRSSLIALGEETMSYEEAMQGSDFSKWKRARRIGSPQKECNMETCGTATKYKDSRQQVGPQDKNQSRWKSKLG